jgi:DNA-binding FadR family transcriptional regulator
VSVRIFRWIAGFMPAPYGSTMGQSSPNEAPSREELLEARARLLHQLEIARYPIRHPNPQLIAKLRAMINEINDCLTDAGPNDA